MSGEGGLPGSQPALDGAYLTQLSQYFSKGVADLNKQVKLALDKVSNNVSDPSILAEYQSVFADYNVFRQLQSTTVKAFRDTDNLIISNIK